MGLRTSLNESNKSCWLKTGFLGRAGMIGAQTLHPLHTHTYTHATFIIVQSCVKSCVSEEIPVVFVSTSRQYSMYASHPLDLGRCAVLYGKSGGHLLVLIIVAEWVHTVYTFLLILGLHHHIFCFVDTDFIFSVESFNHEAIVAQLVHVSLGSLNSGICACGLSTSHLCCHFCFCHL